VRKCDLEKEAVSGSVFSATASQNEMSGMFPYEENKMRVLEFTALKTGII
jgi:hypothetical protein